MIRELFLSYSLTGKEEVIKNFIESFHNKVYSEDRRRSNSTYQRFYDNVRGGWSEKIIVLRRKLLIGMSGKDTLLDCAINTEAMERSRIASCLGLGAKTVFILLIKCEVLE